MASAEGRSFPIEGRRIGGGAPPWMIAEIGINHEGDLDLALDLVRRSAAAGADAVKLQIVCADTLYPPEQWGSEYHTLFKSTELGESDYLALAAASRQLGVVPFASFNDSRGVDVAERMGAPVHKIASTQMTNTPLVRYAAATGKPLIISTGMATAAEIEECLEAARGAGAGEIALLHCVSNYPTRPEDVNLRAMETLRATFGLPVGFSDHSEGLLASTLAAAAGACIIERHVTLSRSRPGYDHRVSLEPAELARLIERVRLVETMLGSGDLSARVSERALVGEYRTSLAAACDIAAGTIIEEEMLIGMRPGSGIAPGLWARVVGRPAKRDLRRGELLRPGDLPED